MVWISKKSQKKAVECGLLPMFRYNPKLKESGENPMKLDYKEPKIPVKEYMYNETRFKMVEKMNAEDAAQFLETATFHAKEMYKRYVNLSKMDDKDSIGEE